MWNTRLLATICVFSSVCGVSWSLLGETRLLKKLFPGSELDRRTVPIESVNGSLITLDIRLDFYLYKVIKLDETEEVLISQLVLQQRWNDYRLTWTPAYYDRINYVTVSAEKIWTPDLLLRNNAKIHAYHEITPQSNYVRVYYDGTCLWAPRYDRSVTHCSIDSKWFPFDEQTCEFNYESWYYLSDEVNITEVNVDLSMLEENDEWLIHDDGLTANMSTEHYRPEATFKLHLRRLPLYYIINLIVPCCLVSFIAALTFILPPSCSERLGLTITILLALTVYQLLVNDKLPTSSDSVPFIGKYFLFVIILCVLAVAATIIVMYVEGRAESVPQTDVPALVKLIVCDKAASVLGLRLKSVPDNNEPATRETLLPPKSRRDQLLIARPVHKESVVGLQRVTNVLDRMHSAILDIQTILLGLVDNTTKSREEEEADEEMKKDWMLAAAVIDRILFILFSLAFVLGTSVFIFMFMFHP